MPSLYNQVELDLQNSNTMQETIDESIKTCFSARANKHKNAIFLEMRRRKDAEDEKKNQIELAKKAQLERRERRKCLREQIRVRAISENIRNNVLPAADHKEYSLGMAIYDVRQYDLLEDAPAGVHTFGGFFGELCLAL